MMQISATELKARLVSFAREIGFDSCRVASCKAPAHANDFREWLRDGAHGEMSYMQRGEEKRCDPVKILAEVRSIVALALNYFQGEQSRRPETAAKGRIARYAWGDDYHDIIGAKLNRIDEFLRGDPSNSPARFAHAIFAVSGLADSSNRGLISSMYQSQNSPQKKS